MAAAVLLGGAWIWVSRVQTAGGGAEEDGARAPRAGFLAPGLELAALDGERVRLDDLRGRPVLVNFWATWCGPCRVEMPHLQEAFEAHVDQDLVVLGVNQMESPPGVAAFVDDAGLTFPILMDSDSDASRVWRVRGLPTSFFIDRQGIIRDVFIGPMTVGLIKSKLELILQEDGG
jgi:peroxiredoxin